MSRLKEFFARLFHRRHMEALPPNYREAVRNLRDRHGTQWLARTPERRVSRQGKAQLQIACDLCRVALILARVHPEKSREAIGQQAAMFWYGLDGDD